MFSTLNLRSISGGALPSMLTTAYPVDRIRYRLWQAMTKTARHQTSNKINRLLRQGSPPFSNHFPYPGRSTANKERKLDVLKAQAFQARVRRTENKFCTTGERRRKIRATSVESNETEKPVNGRHSSKTRNDMNQVCTKRSPCNNTAAENVLKGGTKKSIGQCAE